LFFLPVLIVEGTDIGHAIARTFSLVHKRFWINIGWVAVFIVIIMVISVIFSGIILIPFSGSFLKIMADPEAASNIMTFASNPLYIVLSSAANALYLPALPIFASILYFHGRAVDEEVINP
jgi:membrane-anchored glycerophosphoryl diester phosphodiesterase (GDPDase)